MRAAHTKDVGILLAAAAREGAAFEQGEFDAASDPLGLGGRGNLAAAVAATASDAQALQLSLLERGAASMPHANRALGRARRASQARQGQRSGSPASARSSRSSIRRRW